MLHEFLTSHRGDLIERCRLKVAQRSAPTVTHAELAHGIPLFLDQLIKTLEVEQTSEPMQSRKVSGPAGGGTRVLSEMGTTAALHGRELLQQGFTVDQVVHDYGDLCQAITDLAFELEAPIEIDEFRTLNRCLDNGIADAVTEYCYQRYTVGMGDGVQALNERLGSSCGISFIRARWRSSPSKPAKSESTARRARCWSARSSGCARSSIDPSPMCESPPECRHAMF